MKGRTVTADAMHAQRGTAAAIVASDGDYALALKGQPGDAARGRGDVYGQSTRIGETPVVSTGWEGPSRLKSRCVEKRTATVCHDMDWLLERHDWPGLSAVGKVAAELRLADGATSVDTRYCLLSAQPDVERFGWIPAPTGRSKTPMLRIGTPALGVRVSMDKDCARKGNGAAWLAVIRRLALNVAQMHPDKRSVRRKFLARHAPRRLPPRHDPTHPQARLEARFQMQSP